MTQQQRQALDELLRHAPFDIGGELGEQRALFHEMIASVPLPEDVTATPGRLGGIPVVTVETPGDGSSAVVLYFHGGAYALGSAGDSVGLAADMARRVGVHAVSVDYRLAPEHPFPAAVDDAVAAYHALLADGTPSSEVAFVGESAGGGLAVATLVALKEAGLPQPSSAVVFSPWADLTLSGDSLTGKADVDPALTAKGLQIRARDYLGETDPATPLASPVFADLTGLAPLLIQVGSHEILLDDAVRLAARAAEHDVAVELQVWPQVPHVFQGFAALLDDADAALTSAAAFTRAHWPAG
ncbi:alpha/beta hydrolase fold domain-containing protein [Streptomyces mirabilis]|uniref:alpha/beta hydrolase fold domain-containing protein n=1 Tax=Streptomyces mirabilis TaxID=68239 RepID=UPI0021C2013D|nr:alpha/beta hydrolase fold domain-containing protein [Streptomyces mirabilis]MCT9109266.1 alpha/beta hydrolase fold domain-containing protein [Streptomyces mirabilis]